MSEENVEIVRQLFELQGDEIGVSTVYKFRNGKIVSGQGYETKEAALRAAGLSA
jgi:hypothetical protein